MLTFRHLTWLTILGVLAGATGCNRHIFSPPARPMQLESSATLPEGDTGVQLEGGTHAAVFGPTLVSGTLRVRHGLTDDFEGSIDASFIHVRSTGDDVGQRSRDATSLRAGAKYQIVKHFSI